MISSFFFLILSRNLLFIYLLFKKKLSYIRWGVEEEDGWMLRKCPFEATAEQPAFSSAEI